MKLIGITGKKGSGKSTFAGAIQTFYKNEFQRNVIISPFAAPLKRACYELFGGHLGNYYGTDAEKNTATPFWKKKLGFTLDKDNKRIETDTFDNYRRIMQTIGTELFRNCLHEDFWLMVQERQYEFSKMGFNSIYIIDDVRFDNEAKWVLDHDGHDSEKGISSSFKTQKVCFSDMLQMKTYISNNLKNFISKDLKDCK
jgi:energy-coupling factor transporter ATP-binding protein EcfA2